MNMNDAIFAAATAHVGVQEWPGARHNPAIIEMFADSGHSWVTDDETPWCAAFVGSVLASVGVEGTSKLNARSYMTWGHRVAVEDAQPGDVVVFWRKAPTGPYGHVGFFSHWADNGDPVVLGGNQGNKVGLDPYPRPRLIAVRRATQPRTSPRQSRIVQGSAMATAGVTGSIAITELQGALQEAQGALAQLAPHIETIQYVLLGMALMGALLSLYARLRDWRRGRT